jgi:hypothetical protein
VLTRTEKRFSARPALIALLAAYCATLVTWAAVTWFEGPMQIRQGFLAASVFLAALAGICAGRIVAASRARVPVRERSSFTGRDAGVLTFVALALLVFAGTKTIFPRSWPLSVEKALVMLDAEVDEQTERSIAYLSYDDLGDLQDGLGASIRERFGMLEGNYRLMRDCDREYVQPDVCSSIILSRFWKMLRARLPSAERAPLEALEKSMMRVRLKRHTFEDRPLEEVVEYFNEAIREQLAEPQRFTIRYDEADAQRLVSISWHNLESISLAQALRLLAEKARLEVIKTPPDLRLESRDASKATASKGQP